MADRFDYDPDRDTDTQQDIDEANEILEIFKKECWKHSEKIDETEKGEGHLWDSLICGYALGKGARLQIFPLLQLYWYDYMNENGKIYLIGKKGKFK